MRNTTLLTTYTTLIFLVKYFLPTLLMPWGAGYSHAQNLKKDGPENA
jgi:hypothetical protein